MSEKRRNSGEIEDGDELPPIEPGLSMRVTIEVPGLMPRLRERKANDGTREVVVSTNFEELATERPEERDRIRGYFERFKEEARSIKWLDSVYRAVLKGNRKAFFIPTAGAFIIVVGGVAIEVMRHGREIHELINLINPPKDE